MKNNIFRNSALERLSTPDRLDQPLRVTGSAGWAALIALSALVAASTIAGVVIAIPVKVSGNGIITTSAGIVDVPFSSTGRLRTIDVQLGQHVDKGAVVATLDQPDLRLELIQAQAEQRDLSDQRAQIAGFQAQSDNVDISKDQQKRSELTQQIALAQSKLKLLKERETNLASLFEKRLVSKDRLVDSKIEVGKSIEEIAGLQRQIQGIDLSSRLIHNGSKRELLELDMKLGVAARRVESLATRLREAEAVISPAGGTVAELRRNTGDLVQQGASLMSLVPDGQKKLGSTDGGGLIAVIYVEGSEGKKIFPGMTVEVSPSTFKREEYGFMLGKVKTVAAIPATKEGMMRTLQNQQLVETLSAGGAPFQIEVALDRDPATPSGYRWSSSAGPKLKLSPGALANGQIWVRKVHLIEFVIPALRRLFNDDK